MHELPADPAALLALAFVLGLRHGLDADHLAAIDALTRLRAGRRGARWSGALFAAGHGLVVLAVAAAVAAAQARWAAPAWLGPAGAWTSTLLLFALGLVNLRALLAAPAGEVVRPVGLKARWGLPLGAHPLGAATAGALFAVSFDTLALAALFGSTGPGLAWAVAGAFVAGMALVDGLDGWWVAHLLHRADALAVRAARVMGWAVVAVSLGVGTLGAARLVWPALPGGAAVGAVVAAVLAASYAAVRFGPRVSALRSARRRAP